MYYLQVRPSPPLSARLPVRPSVRPSARLPLCTLCRYMYRRAEKQLPFGIIGADSKRLQFWNLLIDILVLYCVIVGPLAAAFTHRGASIYMRSTILPPCWYLF